MIILFGNDRRSFSIHHFLFLPQWGDIRDSRSGSDASRDYFVALTFEIKNVPIYLIELDAVSRTIQQWDDQKCLRFVYLIIL